jgi:hypothetical protein
LKIIDLSPFFYFCRALRKQIHTFLGIFMFTLLAFSAWSQGEEPELFSEFEMVDDTNALPHAGGASDEEVNSMAIFNERAVELQLLNVRDSIRHIPAYETYCHWDTKNLFAYRADQAAVGTGINFHLAHSDCDFHYPAIGMMTSPFGPRWGRMQYHSSYGNVVVVRHNNGLETLYAHMSQRKVLPGDHVEAGDIIGLGGNTGRSYGAHLHFEFRYMGQAFDPLLIVNPSAQALLASSFTLLPVHYEPAGVSPQTIAARNAAAKPAKSTKAKYHVVKKGDTLYSIARKNGTSINSLCKINRIKESSTLRLGQRIRVK